VAKEELEKWLDKFDPATSLEEHYRQARYCFIPYGWGWGE